MQLAGKAGTSLAPKLTRIPGTGGPVNAASKIVGLSGKGKVAAGIAGATAVGAGVGAAMTNKKNQEKQAAVGLLIEAGVDFESAVSMVEKKAAQLG